MCFSSDCPIVCCCPVFLFFLFHNHTDKQVWYLWVWRISLLKHSAFVATRLLNKHLSNKTTFETAILCNLLVWVWCFLFRFALLAIWGFWMTTCKVRLSSKLWCSFKISSKAPYSRSPLKSQNAAISLPRFWDSETRIYWAYATVYEKKKRKERIWESFEHTSWIIRSTKLISFELNRFMKKDTMGDQRMI